MSEKNKPGPKKKSAPKEHRTKKIQIRVTEEEYAHLKALGDEVGGMTALLRTHLGRVSIRSRRDDQEMRRMLGRGLGLLNQIAKWCNVHKEAMESLPVKSRLVEVERLLRAACDHPEDR